MGGVGASGCKLHFPSIILTRNFVLIVSNMLDGYYTGKHMFDEFTHLRVSIDNPGWYVANIRSHLTHTLSDESTSDHRVDKVAFGFRYPPYKVRA